MVLDHIAHLTGLVKVSPAPFNPHLFRYGNLNMIDSAVIPVINKQRVGKTQRQQIEHRFFAQIVVDTIHLAFFKIFADPIVNLARGRQRSTQRFFHHDARRFGVEFSFA